MPPQEAIARRLSGHDRTTSLINLMSNFSGGCLQVALVPYPKQSSIGTSNRLIVSSEKHKPQNNAWTLVWFGLEERSRIAI